VQLPVAQFQIDFEVFELAREVVTRDRPLVEVVLVDAVQTLDERPWEAFFVLLVLLKHRAVTRH
jgi:hypothetical protein